MKALVILSSCLLFSTTASFAAQPAEKSSLEFKVDKRLETLYYVFLLADYPLVTRFDNTYKADAKTYFQSYKDHQAVTLVRKLMENGFATDYAVSWLYQYSGFPQFKKQGSVNYPFEEMGLNKDSLELLHAALIDFYKTAKCDAFLAKEKSFLSTMIKNAEDSFSRKDVVKVIEDYFGVKSNAKFYIVLSPLLHSGGYSLERTDAHEVYALIGPGSSENGMPVFDKIFMEQDIAIHEFTHNYANIIVDLYMAQSKPLEPKIFPPVKDLVADQGYPDWKTFMYELLVRATTIRIAEKMYGKAAADELVEYEKSVGFQYVVEVCDELAKYETQRDKYPTMTDFYPVILKRLEKIGG